LIEGVIIIVLVMGSLVVFVEVNVGILPVPEFDESPMSVLELVQFKTKPLRVVGFVGVPEIIISGTDAPTQYDKFEKVFEIVGFE
jgi:hypothetical protein